MDDRSPSLYPELDAYIAEVGRELGQIPAQRRLLLDRLAEFIAARSGAGQPTSLCFICTHNSRRSQLAQVWAGTAAAHFGVPGVEAFSGGTEASAFDPRAVAALDRVGFRVERQCESANPIYAVRLSDGLPPLRCFSKVFDQAPNPVADFCAVMTCSAADTACPIVLGATERVSLPYEDPGAFDGTPRETAAYDERCREIAREMLAVFSKVGG